MSGKKDVEVADGLKEAWDFARWVSNVVHTCSVHASVISVKCLKVD